MWFFRREKKNLDVENVYSPLSGFTTDIATVPDPAFSSGAMGIGVAIHPEEGIIYAPFDGEVIALFPTHHAIGIKSLCGLEILIHIGIDTVNMKGRGFKSYVKKNYKISRGTKLIEFDQNVIKEAGYNDITMVIITNADEFEISKHEKQQVNQEDVIICARKKI